MISKSFLFIVLIIVLSSCREQKDNLEDITTVNAKGHLENKEEELSIEDVERLQNSTDGLIQSFTAVLSNEIERPYFNTSDTNQTITYKLTTKSNNVDLILFKEAKKSVKIDSTKYTEVLDYIKISQGDSCSHFSKKSTKYKALVRLKRKFETSDSTAEFTLKVYKK